MKDKVLKFLILRNNKEFLLKLFLRILSNSGNPKIGITFKKNRERLKLFESVKESFNNIFIISVKTLIAFWEILFGKRDHCEVGGPYINSKSFN